MIGSPLLQRLQPAGSIRCMGTKQHARSKMYRKVCPICGVNFIATRSDARYCSPTCRSRICREIAGATVSGLAKQLESTTGTKPRKPSQR